MGTAEILADKASTFEFGLLFGVGTLGQHREQNLVLPGLQAAEKRLRKAIRDIEEPTSEVVEFQFEPNSKAVIGYLLKHYVNIYVYQVLLNAKASEHSARMVSMKGATENADNLIKNLTLQYNKLRQENITNELLDIAGGQA